MFAEQVSFVFAKIDMGNKVAYTANLPHLEHVLDTWFLQMTWHANIWKDTRSIHFEHSNT